MYDDTGTKLAGYGHIHLPYIRATDALTVFNCGSVGMPWDGDPRSSCVLVEDGVPQLIRVEYDVEREAELLRATGHPDADRLAEGRRHGRNLST